MKQVVVIAFIAVLALLSGCEDRSEKDRSEKKDVRGVIQHVKPAPDEPEVTIQRVKPAPNEPEGTIVKIKD